MSYTISYTISYTVYFYLLSEFTVAGYFVPGCPISLPLGALGRVRSSVTGGDDVWFARPQLFFSCSLCPTGHMEDKSSHWEVSLVFFSRFEPITLPKDSYLQKSGILMLFEQAASQLPTLYVCPVENVLGRVPLLQCYMMGNKQNTISHALRYHVLNGAAADSRPNSGTFSRLFEVIIWMWRYGRAFPRKISVKDAEEVRRSRVSESRRRGAENLKHSRLAAAERQQE